jgi:Arc/MetJ-type ribon-helix-helix transcriptional regulator
MKTIAVRVDDATAELLDAVTETTGKHTSDLVRLAIRNLLASAAKSDEKIARIQAEIADRRRADHDRELDEKLGLTPVRFTSNQQ